MLCATGCRSGREPRERWFLVKGLAQAVRAPKELIPIRCERPKDKVPSVGLEYSSRLDPFLFLLLCSKPLRCERPDANVLSFCAVVAIGACNPWTCVSQAAGPRHGGLAEM